ncbi:MAG: hypothetical protein HQL38_06400 [Alphaproteobacteria bacterium]|nr:hypothetical protein [Alphaproteobacteria bacterium]MBF0392295.1 hypothetical protein [Alphaproteobacteria bacterium]
MTMQPIEIFKVGTHTSMSGHPFTFTAEDLAKVAAAYAPDAHKAPLVIGHPKLDDPAYGWVESLEVRGGSLWAEVDGLDPDLVEAIKAGRYKNVSAAFYAPDDANNPAPGAMYLRHVGFLGATAPALKGLKPVAFADDGRAALVFGEIDASARERSLGERERSIRRRETELELDGLIRQGRVLPCHRERLLAFSEALSDTTRLAFSEHGETVEGGVREMFLDYLRACPPVVMFGEMPGIRDKLPGLDDDAAPAGANLPKGYAVDSGRADLHRRAVAYQHEHGTDYRTAVIAVSGR